MKIALVGYGRMGKRIAELATEKGHEIVAKIDSEHKSEVGQLPVCDVAIEFTQPEAALENFRTILSQGIPVVTGTTGWYNHMDEVKELVGNSDGRFFYASNFSPGVFIMHHLTRELSRVTKSFDYRAKIEEWHHTGKKDAPSGTAVTLAEVFLSENEKYDGFHLLNEQSDSHSLPIEAHREGDIKGIHSVTLDSEIDKIELKHEAHTRDGFVLGALMAAEFLPGQQPGFYSMNNLIKL
jgi:4-hydroxy-tetrahydrodipicolinate reductase